MLLYFLFISAESTPRKSYVGAMSCKSLGMIFFFTTKSKFLYFVSDSVRSQLDITYHDLDVNSFDRVLNNKGKPAVKEMKRAEKHSSYLLRPLCSEDSAGKMILLKYL